MKKLILLGLCLTTNAFAGNLTFSTNTKNFSNEVKSFISKTIKSKCPEAIADENVAIVTKITVEVLDQGMENEYRATVKVIRDYGHSGAEMIIIEFDEERYHSEDFSLFNIESSSPNLCK